MRTPFFTPLNIIAIIVAIGLLTLLILEMRRRNILASLLKKSFKYTLFLIKIPPEEQPKEKNQTIKEKINVAEQLISILVNFKKPIVFEIALPEIGEEISYYAAVSQDLEESFKKHLLSFYPKAYVEKVQDYNIFNPNGFTSGVFLKQGENWMLPIKTYTELEADPINPILNAFKLKKEGEGMAIQIIISPAPKSFKSQVTKAIKNLKEGQSFKEVLGKYTFGDFAKEFASSVAPKDKSKEEVKPKVIDENTIKLLESKISKPLCAVNFRIFVSTETKERTEEVMGTLLATFDQFAAPLKKSF